MEDGDLFDIFFRLFAYFNVLLVLPLMA